MDFLASPVIAAALVGLVAAGYRWVTGKASKAERNRELAEDLLEVGFKAAEVDPRAKAIADAVRRAAEKERAALDEWEAQRAAHGLAKASQDELRRARAVLRGRALTEKFYRDAETKAP